jgi:polysaccharide pyruvyl transferase WcaK-like protein/SAM-dependent methyltransferase
MAEHDVAQSILVAASGFVYAPTSSTNLGDRAQLACSVERLRAAFPERGLVALANSLNDEVLIDGLEVSYSAIRYLTTPVRVPVVGTHLPAQYGRAVRSLLLLANARGVSNGRNPRLLSRAGLIALREMKESSALYLSGAGTFNDLYALSVGGFWGILVQSMSRLGKPVVASGQQVGPLARLSRRTVAKRALRRIDLLGVRDPSSMKVARSLGVPQARIVLTGDDAWNLSPATHESARKILAGLGVDGAFIAAQVRFGSSVGWSEADAPALAKSLGRVAKELAMPLVFVPCMTGQGADDRSAADRVRRYLDVPCMAVTQELDAMTTKAILGQASIGVGTANHFCVFAVSMGTPVIGLYATPYMQQKLVGLAELWPGRVIAVTKEATLSPDWVVMTARRLVDEQVHGDEPSCTLPSAETSPDAPVEFLAQQLATPLTSSGSKRPYRERFVEGGSAETYEREFGAGEFMASVSALERDTVREALGSVRRVPFARHLDFACGTGRATGYVEEFVRTTVGVDISEAMLNRAREKFPTARFVCVDIAAAPSFLDGFGRFDLATIWRFMAPADPELRHAALSAVSDVTSDGAVLLVNNNANRTSLRWIVLVIRSLIRGQSLPSLQADAGSISHRELCFLLCNAGFQVVETRGICYLPDQLTRRLPSWSWMPVERFLGRLNLASRYAVNQLLIARRTRYSE